MLLQDQAERSQDYIASTVIKMHSCYIQINSPLYHENLKMLESQLKLNILEVALTLRNLILQYETPSPHSYTHTLTESVS